MRCGCGPNSWGRCGSEDGRKETGCGTRAGVVCATMWTRRVWCEKRKQALTANVRSKSGDRALGEASMAEGSRGVVRRIGLVEDHESVALGFAAMLADQPDLELAGTATTVSGLLEQVTDLDLAVLDLRLSDGSSPQSSVEQLRAAGLETLVFTGAENPYLLRSAARAGVLGVVRKSEPAAVVIEAIRVAAAGGQVASTEWAAAIDGDPELDDVGLSPRQLEV